MNKYELGECIGKGNYGQVFICTHKELNQPVVIKQLSTIDTPEKDMNNILNEINLL